MSNKVNIYIYVMYVYGCNSILAYPVKNSSDKYMIIAFAEFTTDLKTRGLDPGFRVVYN